MAFLYETKVGATRWVFFRPENVLNTNARGLSYKKALRK